MPDALLRGDGLEVAGVPGQPAGGVLGGDGASQPRLPLGDNCRDDCGAVIGRAELADGAVPLKGSSATGCLRFAGVGMIQTYGAVPGDQGRPVAPKAADVEADRGERPRS